MLRFAPRQVCFANIAPVRRFAAGGFFRPSHIRNKRTPSRWLGVRLFGRGRRIRTRDPRFWSGSECPQILENTHFYARFNAFFAQNRVSHLCLKILDAFLML